MIPMLDDQFPPLPVANPTLRRTMARRFAGLAIAATLVVGGVDAAGGQESIDDARSQREQAARSVRQQRRNSTRGEPTTVRSKRR
ncbi:MAG: hypothetical protein R2710_18325 [Acidimicrobiales bacterium]